MSSPKVSIITLNWNGIEDTREFLDSLKRITYPNFAVVVLDNNSKDNQADLLEKEYGDFAKILRNPVNTGFAGGNNDAIRYIMANDPETKYFLLLNNDTVVEPNIVEPLVKAAEESPEYGMISPQMINYYHRDQVDNLGIELAKTGLSFNVTDTQQKLFCPCGGAVLYSRKMLQDVCIDDDYFDSDFFCVAEDVDLGFRAVLQGYKTRLILDSKVYHKVSRSSGGLMSDHNIYHSYRNTPLYLIKDLPFLVFLQYSFWILMSQLGIIMLFIKRGRGRVILRAYMHSFKFWPKMYKKRRIIQSRRVISNQQLKQYMANYIFPRNYRKNLFK